MTQIRTTITLPEDILQEARMQAVREKTTLSGLIRKKLEATIPVKKLKKKLHMKLGKYSFGTTNTFRRKDMYEEYLKHKFPR